MGRLLPVRHKEQMGHLALSSFISSAGGRWRVGFGGQQRDWTGLKGWVMALLLEECLTVLSDGSLQVSEVIVYRLPGFTDRVS